MKILAIIPARAGSKRLPRKNTSMLGGKPLFYWSIDVAKKVTEISDILITTDDQYVIDLCSKYKDVKICFRPPELSTDEAKTIDVIKHAIEFYKKTYDDIDGVILLQPTSPFRSVDSIHKAIKFFVKNKSVSIVSVSKIRENPSWMFKFIDNSFLPLIESKDLNKELKKLNSVYILNGSIYLFPPIQLKKNSLISTDSIPIVIDSYEESIDIDTKFDFELAEFFLSKKHSLENQR